MKLAPLAACSSSTSTSSESSSAPHVARRLTCATTRDRQPLMTTPSVELRSAFGDIDIYLFDQLARGHFDRRRRVLDAGCGDGRNLVYFLQERLHLLRYRSRRSRPSHRYARWPTGWRRLHPRLTSSPVSSMSLPWPDGSMDAVIASAVLHFVRDEPHFARIVQELWRVLAPRGLLFARLASTIGLEAVLGPVAGTRVRLPDGSDRFVVDLPMLLDWTERLGGHLIDPIKTTNVQGQRCMTTWCVEKSSLSSAPIPATGAQSHRENQDALLSLRLCGLSRPDPGSGSFDVRSRCRGTSAATRTRRPQPPWRR